MGELERPSAGRSGPTQGSETANLPGSRGAPRRRLFFLTAMAAGLLAALAPPPARAQAGAPPTPSPGEAGPAPAPSGEAAPAQDPASPRSLGDEVPVSEAVRQEALQHFEKGLALLGQGALGPALAEFMLSRKLFPTRAATRNAAIALRELQRHDEALDMFEAFLRDFNASAAERAAVQRDIAELRARVGTIDITGAEPGASIVVSGEDRGQYPPFKPIRVPAGPHVIRVFKEGFESFERRVDVAGGQTVPVQARLRRLLRSGRLRVVERTGKTVDVLVDNVVVGRTPWLGPLSVGNHMVALRGEGKLGSQPTAAPVRPQELTTLSLLAEELDASLRVNPTPPGASVWINSVNVGNGVWLGRLKKGQHHVEVKADGFMTGSRTVTLDSGEREVVTLQLERDDDAPLWRKPPKIALDASASFLLAPTLGGDVAGCSGGCSRSLGLGGAAFVHGAYELGSGLGFGVEVGGLMAFQGVEGRDAELYPVGVSEPDRGSADDDLRLSGALVGATIGYHVEQRFPLQFRVGAGVLLGQVRDERSGNFTARDGSVIYAAPAAAFSSATCLYLDPEARIGARFAERFEVSVGVKLLVLIAPEPPRWDPTIEIPASTDGIGTYRPEPVMGDLVFLVAPGVSLRHDF
ncbi:PEGA domain-containing protein [Sorangium sp. So ce136]|uniref:PEGA domain-containing protein n=1 Tax=Sorangium sp. So ce136 TaxID=3133284 RepID=UPI003F070313